MANTYTLIEAKTLTSTAASVTFSAIPATFTDLVVLLSVRSDRSGQVNDSLALKPNGSASNRSARALIGDGGSASSGVVTDIAHAALAGDAATANTFSNISVYCPNYTSANFKSFSADGVMENNATTSYMSLSAFLWSDTAVISSLEFLSGTSSNFISGCTFYLYGISNS